MTAIVQGSGLGCSRIDVDSVGGLGSSGGRDRGGMGEEGPRPTYLGGPRPEAEAPRLAAGGVVPPDLSNTRGELVSRRGLFSAVSAGGEDWLQYFQHVEWENGGSALFRILKDAKEKAQSGSGETFQEVPGLGLMSVGRQGFTIGGVRGTYFEFKCGWRGLELGFSDRPGRGVRRHNFSVLGRGDVCLQRGAAHLVQEVRRLIAAWRGCAGPEDLSRVDACVDLAGVSVGKFVRPFQVAHFVSRCKSRAMFWGDDGEVTGFQVGKGASVLRVYDKLVELKGAMDAVTLQAMCQYRWGGSLPEAASRVEWQLRREALQGHGVSTWDDWLQKRGAILQDLMNGHFRLVNGNHSQRRHAEVLPVWVRAAAAFDSWAGQVEADLSPLDRGGIDGKALCLQGLGCFVTALLNRGRVPGSVDDLLAGIADLVREHADMNRLGVEIGRKAVALGVDEVAA